MRIAVAITGFSLFVVLVTVSLIEVTGDLEAATLPASLTSFPTLGPLLLAVSGIGLLAVGLLGLAGATGDDHG